MVGSTGRGERIQLEARARSASQVKGGPVTVEKAGESVPERPGGRHGVGAHAGETEPARRLALFVGDRNETELTTPFGD